MGAGHLGGTILHGQENRLEDTVCFVELTKGGREGHGCTRLLEGKFLNKLSAAVAWSSSGEVSGEVAGGPSPKWKPRAHYANVFTAKSIQYV